MGDGGDTEDLRAAFAKLVFATGADPYLVDVGTRVPSHAFLARGTLAVYLRQVGFLAQALPDYLKRGRQEIEVLDWGCGKGHNAYLLRQAGFRVVAADVAEAAAGGSDSSFRQATPILQEQGIAPVPLRHAYELPFEDGRFDCVTSFGVLEHVPHERESLREIRRVLKPGGLFYVSFLPYRTSWTQCLDRLSGGDYHDRLYTRSGVRRLARDAGFEVVGIHLGQLLPKNPVPRQLSGVLEPLDQLLCRFTPLGLLATNLEVILRPARPA